MNRLWQTLLGIERSPGAVSEGDSRLEFTGLPQGLTAVALILAAIAVLFLLWGLYRWERRDLSRPKRALLVGFRVLTLLALVTMLVEPVLISSQRETVRSHLALILDDSDSMNFSDPYTDESRAVEIAAGLQIPSKDGRSSIQILRETPRLNLVKTRSGHSNWKRSAVAGTCFCTIWNRRAGRARANRRGHARSTRSSRTARSLHWVTPFMECWGRIAASQSPA